MEKDELDKVTLWVPFHILNDLTGKDDIDIVQECENGTLKYL